MKFVDERQELALTVTKVAPKPGKGEIRFLVIEFALKLNNALAEKLPKWVAHGYQSARDVSCGAVAVGFDKVVESQNIEFQTISRADSGPDADRFTLSAVNLYGFEIDQVKRRILAEVFHQDVSRQAAVGLPVLRRLPRRVREGA